MRRVAAIVPFNCAVIAQRGRSSSSSSSGDSCTRPASHLAELHKCLRENERLKATEAAIERERRKLAEQTALKRRQMHERRQRMAKVAIDAMNGRVMVKHLLGAVLAAAALVANFDDEEEKPKRGSAFDSNGGVEDASDRYFNGVPPPREAGVVKDTETEVPISPIGQVAEVADEVGDAEPEPAPQKEGNQRNRDVKTIIMEVADPLRMALVTENDLYPFVAPRIAALVNFVFPHSP